MILTAKLIACGSCTFNSACLRLIVLYVISCRLCLLGFMQESTSFMMDMWYLTTVLLILRTSQQALLSCAALIEFIVVGGITLAGEVPVME